MYQLTCPACSTCVDRPFVRVGARAVCGKCEHTYQVAGDQLKHEVVIPEFSPSANPLLLGGAATKPPPPMDLTKHDLYVADEMFLTGTAAEIIPVTKVDGRAIGDGKPGQLTLKLIGKFRELVTTNAPED